MEYNYCPGCGGKIMPGTKYCAGCGRELTAESDRGGSGKNRQLLSVLILLGAIAVIGLIFFLVSTKKEPPEIAQQPFEHPPIQGMPSGTAPNFDNIIATLPKSYDSLVNAGNHFMDNQIFRLAVECYSRALAIDSSDPNIHTDLGACYHYLGEREKAIVSFNKALEINADHAIAHFNMGIVYRELKNVEKTRYHWNKYIELDPRAPIADSIRKYLDNLGPQ